MPELIRSTLVAMLTDDKVSAHSCYLTKGQARVGTGYHEAQFISFSGMWYLISTIVFLAGSQAWVSGGSGMLGGGSVGRRTLRKLSQFSQAIPDKHEPGPWVWRDLGH